MNNFVPMRITIYLESGYCKLSNMPFDSILAKLYFQKDTIVNSNEEQEIDNANDADITFTVSVGGDDYNEDVDISDKKTLNFSF